MKIAAIDVGSNSIKLVVVDAAASDSFAVLVREKDSVRLGHDTLLQGRLSPDAISRAVECIKRFRAIAETPIATAKFLRPSKKRGLFEQVFNCRLTLAAAPR